jgi:hypothetical protein
MLAVGLHPVALAWPIAPASGQAATYQSHVFNVFYGTSSRTVPVAKLEYSVRQAGDRYEIRTRARADGLIALIYSGVLTQVSEGRIGLRGLEPDEYAEQRGNRPQQVIRFDHIKGRLTTADHHSTVRLPPGTQDRLSVLYQLGFLARATPERFLPGSQHEVPVASMNRVIAETFVVVGEAMLPSAEGPLRVLHLVRPAPRDTKEPRIDVWLGYDMGMLPLRLRFEDAGGMVLDQVIHRAG